jgi:hypothetical protein
MSCRFYHSFQELIYFFEFAMVLSFVLSYSLVVDSGKDLLWDFFADPADLRKNVFRRARCESGCLALKVTKQEEVAGCTTSRISQIGNHVGFGSGNLLQ